MAQYLPLYELSHDDYQMIMRSFAKVFPDCILFLPVLIPFYWVVR